MLMLYNDLTSVDASVDVEHSEKKTEMHLVPKVKRTPAFSTKIPRKLCENNARKMWYYELYRR